MSEDKNKHKADKSNDPAKFERQADELKQWLNFVLRCHSDPAESLKTFDIHFAISLRIADAQSQVTGSPSHLIEWRRVLCLPHTQGLQDAESEEDRASALRSWSEIEIERVYRVIHSDRAKLENRWALMMRLDLLASGQPADHIRLPGMYLITDDDLKPVSRVWGDGAGAKTTESGDKSKWEALAKVLEPHDKVRPETLRSDHQELQRIRDKVKGRR